MSSLIMQVSATWWWLESFPNQLTRRHEAMSAMDIICITKMSKKYLARQVRVCSKFFLVTAALGSGAHH